MNTLDNDLPKTAVLQIPSEYLNGSPRRIDCQFSSFEGNRLRLEAAERIPVSTAVTVQYNDALFLGEVFACRSSSTSFGKECSFRTEILVEQILTGLESLMGLRAQLLGEGFPHTSAEMGVPVSVARRA